MSNETAANIFDQEETIIAVGTKGLDLPAKTHHGVVWGVISYQQRDFKDKNVIVDSKIIVVQFPKAKDEKGKAKVGWAFSSSYLAGKAKFGVYLKGIYGESIETNHPIRLPNGNIDPKKLFGKNCLVTVANVSKVEGEICMGITAFSPLMDDMQEYPIDTSVEMPKYLIDLKNGKYLNDNHQEEAPAIPQGAKTAPAAESPKPVPPVPVTTTAAATVETEEAKAKRTRKPKEEAKPAAVAEVAKPAVVVPAGPFKTFWRVIDGIQQTCSECGERQYIYNTEGKWTCKGKHSNIPSKESLLDDAPPADEDMSPTDADNITA